MEQNHQPGIRENPSSTASQGPSASSDMTSPTDRAATTVPMTEGTMGDVAASNSKTIAEQSAEPADKGEIPVFDPFKRAPAKAVFTADALAAQQRAAASTTSDTPMPSNIPTQAAEGTGTVGTQPRSNDAVPQNPPPHGGNGSPGTNPPGVVVQQNPYGGYGVYIPRYGVEAPPPPAGLYTPQEARTQPTEQAGVTPPPAQTQGTVPPQGTPPAPPPPGAYPPAQGAYPPPAGQMPPPPPYYGMGDGRYPQQPLYAGPNGTGNKSSTLSVISLVLGILSIVINCGTYFLGAVLAIPAIILAILSRDKETRRMDGMAKAGLITAIVGLAITVLFVLIFTFVVFFIILMGGNGTGGVPGGTTDEFYQIVSYLAMLAR